MRRKWCHCPSTRANSPPRRDAGNSWRREHSGPYGMPPFCWPSDRHRSSAGKPYSVPAALPPPPPVGITHSDDATRGRPAQSPGTGGTIFAPPPPVQTYIRFPSCLIIALWDSLQSDDQFAVIAEAGQVDSLHSRLGTVPWKSSSTVCRLPSDNLSSPLAIGSHCWGVGSKMEWNHSYRQDRIWLD